MTSISVTICPPGRAKGIFHSKGSGVDTTMTNLSRRLDGTRSELPRARAQMRSQTRKKSARSLAEDAPLGTWKLAESGRLAALELRRAKLVTGKDMDQLMGRLCAIRGWGWRKFQRRATVRLAVSEYDISEKTGGGFVAVLKEVA